MTFNINEFLCSPWTATHIVKQQGNGVLTPVDNPENYLLPVNKVEIIEGTSLNYPFRVMAGDKALSVAISVTEEGREWFTAHESGWWCVKLKKDQDVADVLRALTKVKPATPVGVVKKTKAKQVARPAEYDEFKIGQKVQLVSRTELRGNIFGTVTEEAGLIGEVVELGIRNNQGIRVEVPRKGRTPCRYVYEAKHLLLFSSKKKAKAKDLPPVEKLIAKRMRKIKTGDRVLIVGDIAAKYPDMTSAWTDVMYERIGQVGTVERLHSAFEVQVDGYLYHILDLAKV